MKSSKVGAIVLATEQGLGYLAKSFYDNGLIDVVYIKPHTSRENHYEWYPDRVGTPDELLDCSTLIFFEEVFEWNIIPKARAKGIKTVLMVMYECTRNPLPYEPDVILCPSLLDLDYYKDKNAFFLPVPVSVKHRIRHKAEVFVHNAGNGGLGGRNGTKELIEAWEHVKSPARLIIRSQVPITKPKDTRIEVRVGTFDDIWSEGDVFIFPEKFNGLSLPLQEAFASGMLVMCGDRFPMNTWLPKEPLIPVSGYKKEKIAVEFNSAVFSPSTIARVVDEWYNKDIEKYSVMGKEWAKKNSWENLKKLYENHLR